MPCPVERPWATGFISSVMAHALWDAQSVQIVGMQWSTDVCLFVSCPLLPLSITVNTFLYSHLDPLNYPLTNANKKTNTVEDSSSWWKCNRKILSLSILRVWPVQYMMKFVCMLTPQLDDVDLCKHMRITLITLVTTRWYYVSYLQMTNANDPLLKLLASAPCPWPEWGYEMLGLFCLRYSHDHTNKNIKISEWKTNTITVISYQVYYNYHKSKPSHAIETSKTEHLQSNKRFIETTDHTNKVKWKRIKSKAIDLSR